MSRRNHVVAAIAALCVAPVVFASDAASDTASDRICIRGTFVRTATVRAKLAEAFARKPEPAVPQNEFIAPMGPMEVIVARIGADGKPVMSCVDSPEAAERFFGLAIEQLPKPKHKEAKEE
ncbi:MAG TPA: hypothetical protein VEK57_19970 [Thermoanaerobaculia bacterium]|nr:hypothetical protein [Thermoanaerobaculia bacterium]